MGSEMCIRDSPDSIDFELHSSLLENTVLMDMVFEANEAQNQANEAGGGTYLLSQVRVVPTWNTPRARDTTKDCRETTPTSTTSDVEIF